MPFLARTSGAALTSDAPDGCKLGATGPRREKVLGKRLLRLLIGASVGRKDGRLLKALARGISPVQEIRRGGRNTVLGPETCPGVRRALAWRSLIF